MSVNVIICSLDCNNQINDETKASLETETYN